MALGLNGLSTAVISFVVFAIILGIGGLVLSEVSQTQCAGYWNESSPSGGSCETSDSDATPLESVSYNATGGGLEGVETFGDWLPTIAVILASAFIIGIIAMYFYMR